ncbi:putative bifunctional diguanylate cyclase/phosphodiesterase [Pseudomonas sp. Marseille-QA0892]
MATDRMLGDLVHRLGLDPAELAERCRLLEWTARDAYRLSQLAPHMGVIHRTFVDHLYQHLGSFKGPSALFKNPNVLGRLKKSQLDYYHRLWHGSYDGDYIDSRLRIGLIHQQLGVEMKWYLGAYRMYLDQVLAELPIEEEPRAVFASLLKIVFFDMTLAIDTYSAAQRKATEDSEARFARALRGANDGIWEWHIEHDRLYVSERWVSMLGMNRDTFGETSSGWFNRVHPDDLPGLRQAIDSHLRGETAFLRHEYRIRHVRGIYMWVQARGVMDEESGDRRIAGSQSDIGASKSIEEQLQHAARHDPLTGLGNRLRLEEILAQTQQYLKSPSARAAALLFVDLDRFKLINDSLGHHYGDQVLIEASQRLRRCLRPGDHLLRFGGDEFVVLLIDLTKPSDAEQVAQRMLDNLYIPMHVNGQTLVVSASIGITELLPQADSESALQAADLALYRAKQAGKAQFARFTDDLQAAAKRQLALESALGQALDRKEYVLHYQPIVKTTASFPELVGVEALLRWQHDGRLISPQEFIPSLEESGEIARVGEWVLREACRQTREWQEAGEAGLYCSVNLSSRQLQQDDFVGRLVATLNETGLSPTSLVLEITETQLMDDSAATLVTLRALSNLGIRLALDDFGTGYSSLGYLKRFPLNILKVDKSFIRGTPDDAELSVISRAIIGLGRNLGLEVVAEGVESKEHLSFLNAEGCTLAQGYWFSRPRPAADLQPLFLGKAALGSNAAV